MKARVFKEIPYNMAEEQENQDLLGKKIHPREKEAIPFLHYLLAILYFTLSLALTISSATSTDPRPYFPIILWGVTCLAFIRAFLSMRATDRPAFMFYDSSTLLMIFSFCCISFQLLFRLYDVSHFGGHIANLNFGMKCDQSGECSSNLSFTASYESYGHAVQGLFSVLLFPSVRQRLYLEEYPVSTGVITELGSLVTLVYPVYNLIKRAYKSADSFAISSFSNNMIEWAVGFWIGLEFGFFHNYIMSESKRMEYKWLRVRQSGALLLLLISVASAVLFGLSWNNTTSDDDVHENPEDIVVLIVLIGFPFAGFFIFLGFFGYKWVNDCFQADYDFNYAVELRD